MQWLAWLAQLGAAQGFMLALALLTIPYGQRRANRALAAFIGVVSLRLIVLSLNYAPEAIPARWLAFETYHLLHVIYLFGPLLYFYVRLLVEPQYRLTRLSLWHFVPVLVATLIFLPGGPLVEAGLAHYGSFEQLPEAQRTRVALGSVPAFVSLFIYALIALRYLQHHALVIQQEFSAIERINLAWLRVLVWFCLVSALVSGVVETLRGTLGVELGPRVFSSVALSVLMIYYIGLMGIRQPAIFDQGEPRFKPQGGFQARGENAGTETFEVNTETAPKVNLRDVTSKQESTEQTSPSTVTSASEEKYQKSGLGQEQVERLWQKLGQLMMVDKPYQQQGIKLAELAKTLGTRPNYLSQVINSCSGQNFFEYINSHRVAEAKRMLEADRGSQRTISDIALEAGFSSQNVFNGHFKKLAGMTPSQYRKTLENHV